MRRISDGFVFTLHAMYSDVTGSPPSWAMTVRIWTATANRLFKRYLGHAVMYLI
jgi:hypothetical protein